MRTILATLAVATTILTVPAPPVQAAPTTVDVRVEGRTETLFEGPVLTDGHNVRASSDLKAPPSGRRCNGLNNGQNPSPGPTPTAAAVDAMSILGEDFDGRWYAEPFEDYFIERWGPDAEDEGAGEYWGLIVNNVFTGVGGCQYQLDGGDEVLWAYDAFGGRPRLALYPADYSAGPVALTASVQLGEPFAVEVDAWDGYDEGSPPPSPQRDGGEPFEGAKVAPVVAGAGGFETVDADDPITALSDEAGLAEISFGETGWQRIKAVASGAGGGRPRSAPTASTSVSTPCSRANARRRRSTTRPGFPPCRPAKNRKGRAEVGRTAAAAREPAPLHPGRPAARQSSPAASACACPPSTAAVSTAVWPG